jgi:hypothetical protein
MLPVNQGVFDEWVGPPVDVKPIYDCKTLHESVGIAFELYKEACRVVVFAAHLLDDTAATQGGFSRNQAICAGLMVKISKFMGAVIQLSTSDARGEIVVAGCPTFRGFRNVGFHDLIRLGISPSAKIRP